MMLGKQTYQAVGGFSSTLCRFVLRPVSFSSGEFSTSNTFSSSASKNEFRALYEQKVISQAKADLKTAVHRMTNPEDWQLLESSITSISHSFTDR